MQTPEPPLEEVKRRASAQLGILAELKKHGTSYDTLKLAAQAYIKSFEEFQRLRYGRVRTRISVNRLLH